MKIFAYVGTSRRGTSNTYKITKALISQIVEDSNVEVEYQIYHPENVKLLDCIGCVNCFHGKTCPLDRKDDMPQLKREMLAADVIILGSPVYLHHVSGTVKTFIDRVSYWAHLLKLAGKVGVSISTSSTNGNEFVDYYIDKFQLYVGIHAVKPLSLPMDLLDQDEIDEFIRDTSKDIIVAYQNLSNLKPPQKQEEVFQTFKKMFLTQNGDLYESKYWIDNGLTEFKSFKELRDTMIYDKKIKEKTGELY